MNRLPNFIDDIKVNGTTVFSETAGIKESVHTLVYQVEDLSAGVDIADRILFTVPTGYTYYVTEVNLIAHGTASGIDNSNTCVFKLDDGTNTIVTKTYNTGTTFPAATTPDSLTASISTTYYKLTAGEKIRLSVTNGSTADTPAFIIQVNMRVVKS